jgi:uncharacterized membrane protein YdjX (TVP38/TMEM64 family)
MEETKNNKLRIIRIIIQAVVLILLVVFAIIACIKLYPIFIKIQNDEIYRNEVVAQIQSTGFWGGFILILIQVFQTVLAVIPSGPVVIIAGMMYDPWIAVLICLIGQTLGALVVIGLVKLFGYTFISLFVDLEKVKQFKLLNNEKKCAVLMFSYSLIPLLPKDPLAFIVPFTKVKTWVFLIITFVARMPMTIVSVVFGNSLISGEFGLGIIIACISGLLALVCFIFNNKIVEYLEKLSVKKSE